MPLFTLSPQKSFADLGEREILALAITLEEEDGRIYRDYRGGAAGRATRPRPRCSSDMAEEESRHRRMLIELYPREVRRAHPAGPPRGRARLRPPQADVADPAARASRRCAGRPRSWRPRSRTSTARRPSRSPMPASASCWSTWPRPRTSMSHLAERAGARAAAAERAPGRGGDASGAVRAAGGPARPRRPDGRLGLDAGAPVRRRLRHRQQLGGVPGRHRGLDRRRHLDGLRRGALRRRQPHRPRPSLDARLRLRG